MSHIVIESSLRGMGDVSLTIKEVPDELHQRIIQKYGNYQSMLEYQHPDEYEEFLNCKNVKVFEHIIGENE